MTIVAGGLITLEYAAEGLNWKDVGSGGNTVRDADLTAYIQAATPIIENIVGPVLPVTKVRTFDGGCSAIILNDRANTITSVVESGVASPGFTFDPIGGVIYPGTSTLARDFTWGRQNIVVTYTVGYTPIPQTLQLATRELVRLWIQQGKNANRPQYGDAVEVASTPMGFAIPKRVMELCGPYLTAGFA